MKKIIPALAVIAGAAALVAYKLKKDEEKQIVDLDQGLLEDEDDLNEMDIDDEIEEGPISDPASCMETVKKEAADAAEDLKDLAKDAFEEGKEAAEDFADAVKNQAAEAKDIVQDAAEEFDTDFPSLLKSETAALKEQAKKLMDDMLQEGDVHENERPVQHSVVFQTAEDMDSFKNEVINKGFVITRGDEDLELIVLHITPIDDVKLMGNILYIAGEAKLHHGKYQGWSSKVIY